MIATFPGHCVCFSHSEETINKSFVDLQIYSHFFFLNYYNSIVCYKRLIFVIR